MTLLHSNATARCVVILTRYVFAVWILKFLLDPFEEVTSLPGAYLWPVGIIKLIPEHFLSEVINPRTLFQIRLVIIFCCVACQFRSTFTLFAPFACVLITAEQSLIRSYGYMNHTEIPLVLAAWVLTIFALADSWRQTSAEDQSYNRHAAPFVMIAMLLCLTYSIVGITRLTQGGYEIFTGDFMLKTALNQSHRPWLVEFDWGKRIDGWPLLALALKLGFPLITIVEILAPLCLVSLRFRIVFIFFMMNFHIMNLLLLKLPFFECMLLLVIFVNTPWRWNKPRTVGNT